MVDGSVLGSRDIWQRALTSQPQEGEAEVKKDTTLIGTIPE